MSNFRFDWRAVPIKIKQKLTRNFDEFRRRTASKEVSIDRKDDHTRSKVSGYLVVLGCGLCLSIGLTLSVGNSAYAGSPDTPAGIGCDDEDIECLIVTGRRVRDHEAITQMAQIMRESAMLELLSPLADLALQS